jgi:small subunit ribosomal protein S21
MVSGIGEFVLTPKLERGYTSAQQWTSGRGGAIQLSEIKVRENETFESALRRFNKKIKQNGVLSEVRRREHYEKPSVKRKKKIAAARKRRARAT